MASEAGSWRAHGIVGPGKILGAVTRKRYAAPYFKLVMFYNLFHVGLCPHGKLPLKDAWLHQNRQGSPQGRRSRGPESTRSLLRHVRQKEFK